MAVNDANYLMMSKQVLEAVKSFLRLKKKLCNLLRLLLLPMLMMRIMWATVCCRFRSWGLVIQMNAWDFEVDVRSRFSRWDLIKICVRACEMNSTLGSDVPLARFSMAILEGVQRLISQADYNGPKQQCVRSEHVRTPKKCLKRAGCWKHS